MPEPQRYTIDPDDSEPVTMTRGQLDGIIALVQRETAQATALAMAEHFAQVYAQEFAQAGADAMAEYLRRPVVRNAVMRPDGPPQVQEVDGLGTVTAAEPNR